MAFLDFNAADVAPAQAFEPIPAGDYDAKIISSEIKPTTNGAGTRLNLTFEIIGGEHNGRKVFEGLNIKHTTSEKAQQIGQEQLSAICHAIGVMNLRDTNQLHGIPMQIKVKVRAATTDDRGQEVYAARNEIKGWTKIGGGTSAKPGTAAPQQRPAGAPQQRPAAAGAGRPAAAGTGAPAQRPAAQQRPAAAQQRPSGQVGPSRPAPAAQTRPAPAPAPVEESQHFDEAQNADEALLTGDFQDFQDNPEFQDDQVPLDNAEGEAEPW